MFDPKHRKTEHSGEDSAEKDLGRKSPFKQSGKSSNENFLKIDYNRNTSKVIPKASSRKKSNVSNKKSALVKILKNSRKQSPK